MENKTILITGANGGLGTAFVKEVLKQNPKKVYCTVRDIQKKEELESLSDRIEVVKLNIINKSSIEDLASSIKTLDILINNAGVNSNNRLFDENFFDIEVNLKGTAMVTKAFFDKLKSSKGKVVNVTSILALANLPLMANYCISKAALHSFTQALRAEFALFGGEVYEVLPGPIETRMTEGFPMPKAKPEEIAAAVVEGMGKKEFEIYPDAFSQMAKQRVQSEPEKLMEEFTASLNA